MIEDLWTFINNRHSIYLKRKAKEDTPWTEDPILQQYTFSNIFRELDPTTIAIRRVLNKLYHEYKESVSTIREKDYIYNQFVNVILYRIFNNRRNTRFGPIYNPTAFYYFMDSELINGNPILKDFTPKVFPSQLEDLCRLLLSNTSQIIDQIQSLNTLEKAYQAIKAYEGMNDSLAYDLACDLRYTDILRHATDVNSWGYIGEGSLKGLNRIQWGLSIVYVQDLYNLSIGSLSGHRLDLNHWMYNHYGDTKQYPYFELREIITSLRLFNQYESIRLNEEHHVPLFEKGKQ